MRTSLFFFIAIFMFSLALSAQSQYTSVPRSGEGRVKRSNQTVFWANPIFFKPAVFFSSSEVNVRANRKWWRNKERLLPVPFVADGYLPDDITLESFLNAGFIRAFDQFSSDQKMNTQNSQGLLKRAQKSAVQYLAEAGRTNQSKRIRTGFPKKERTYSVLVVNAH